MAEDTKYVVKNDEEQEVKDTDADTGYVERQENSDFSEMSSFMEKIDARMRAIESSMQSIKDAQSIVINNGAIIRDDSPQDDVDDYVDTRTIAELDLSL